MGWFIALLAAVFLSASAALAQDENGTASSGFDSALLQNAPEVARVVRAGARITQITSVDQKAENFTAVVRVRLEWNDPALAFGPEDWPSSLRTMATADFVEFARQNAIFAPVASFENLQARSFTKQSVVAWTGDGDAIHASETVVTLQAPDFNFLQYPFDMQTFFVRLILNAPVEFARFEVLEGFGGMGPTLGEEEWVVRKVWEQIDTNESMAGWESSRYSLAFSADRHLIYYWMRIFLPLLLLVAVSWANLFLEEYRRRIDIAGANLLAFIAFNFTISGELPRLGYVTFLDALLLAMFVVSALAVAYNVMLRRLSINGEEERARAIDWHITIWVYPLIYALTLTTLWILFFP